MVACWRGLALLPALALTLLYTDACLRVIYGLFGDGFGPLLRPLSPAMASRAAALPTTRTASQEEKNVSTAPKAAAAPQSVPVSAPKAEAVPQPVPVSPTDGGVAPAAADDDENWRRDACLKHELLLGNLHSDLAPWVDRQLRIKEQQMRDAINMVDAHRGFAYSWVTDTMTPLLIVNGKLYLPLGPPRKDPTNYFWTVLMDLQHLARTVRLPDVELLLNFADMPVVYAADGGQPTAPGFPVFSYCKRDRFLDILIPGYYTPDRVCRAYQQEGVNKRHPWRAKRRVAFARYTHFCKRHGLLDDYGRPLPPCARSYFASLAMSADGGERLDVRPMNVWNDSSDPSLLYGKRLLIKGEGLPMSEHGRYAYLLDTDGFSSAYKLQQLLSTNSLVLHHRSPWRAYYYKAMLEYVHYVPLWHSAADDVLRTIDWLAAHDSVAHRIAANGQYFACEHLTQPGRLCYWQRAIEHYAALLDYKPTLRSRPRAFPLDRINFMCRIRDAPVVCYYNIHPPGRARQRAPIPDGYVCEKPVPGANGSFEECWYRGKYAAAT